ncbi:MAG TPA: M28 family peptidase, partial [Cyclobacteriaceae bacterium]|nr:M28 family peptidase [Cyclobacteriaceae bacterium]
MKKISTFLSLCLIFSISFAQTEDEKMIKAIFDKALSDGQSYEMLEYLTTKIGARISGSPQAAAAVEWSRQVMTELNFDKVFLQDVMVPHWVRGQQEIGRVVQSKKGAFDFNVCAIGMSVGTGPSGVYGKVIEVKGFDELEKLGKEKIEGNIVFFNRPFDPPLINTFAAYGGAVGQRASGASEAAKYGAAGVVVRSMGSNLEDYPHTGGLNYRLNIPKIPAIAIATRHAEQLSVLLKDDPDLRFYFETHCQTLEDKPSHNVVGELKGKRLPNEYIVVGGHLDSWDLGQGAHDDGAGCVQSI